MIGTSTDNFKSKVLELVRAIPYGCVSTYGQIAAMAGAPGRARQVGYILYHSDESDELPWHRVINSKGHISLPPYGGFEVQKSLLLQEGIVFDGQDRVDLRRFGWLAER